MDIWYVVITLYLVIAPLITLPGIMMCCVVVVFLFFDLQGKRDLET